LTRDRKRSTAALAFAASIAAAAATLGTAIYLVSTSLPYLVDSAAADPEFGALNQCLISSLREPRAGFAVSPSGSAIAAYGASSVAVCEATALSNDGGSGVAGVLRPLAGISAASFDLRGTLWLASARGPRPELFVAAAANAPLRRVGEFSPIALVGLASGAAVLDSTGRLCLFSLNGSPEHCASVPAGSSAVLAANSNASLLSMLADNTIQVFRSADLSQVRSESPCRAEFLWWLSDPAYALISCGPNADFALVMNVVTGERESAPRKDRPRSVLVPRVGKYVQDCERLPCSTPAP
jgi:hypothetical protein